MRNITSVKAFLQEVEFDKSMIFDYKKVSSFERELFLSIQSLLKENYQYNLKGMTKVHYKKLKEEISSLDKFEELVETAFELNSMIASRTTDLGYGGSSTRKVIKNNKLELFIESLKRFIELYN